MKLSSRLTLTTALAATASTALADDGWNLVHGTQVQFRDGSFEMQKVFPERLRQGATGIELTGYAVPIIQDGNIERMMLISDMGLCPLCGGSDHTATIQINLAAPIDMIEDGTRITLRGDLVPVSDADDWQVAVLENAVIVPS